MKIDESDTLTEEYSEPFNILSQKYFQKYFENQKKIIISQPIKNQ